MMALIYVVATAALGGEMVFGPPIPVGGGGKMSNTLDLYPAGACEAHCLFLSIFPPFLFGCLGVWVKGGGGSDPPPLLPTLTLMAK